MKRGVAFVAAAVLGIAALSALRSQRTVAEPSPAASVEATPLASVRVTDDAVASKPTLEVAPQPSANPELERLQARRLLYETVDAFLQAGELEKARKLLDAEQARHGDDLAPEWRDWEQSYRLIADCLDDATPQQRARARAFASVSEAVALKQRLLAACEE